MTVSTNKTIEGLVYVSKCEVSDGMISEPVLQFFKTDYLVIEQKQVGYSY